MGEGGTKVQEGIFRERGRGGAGAGDAGEGREGRGGGEAERAGEAGGGRGRPGKAGRAGEAGEGREAKGGFSGRALKKGSRRLRAGAESVILRAEGSTMEFQYEKERIFACDEAGKVIAEITFPVSQGVADINHTFVDGSLRGQGVAGRLTEAAVASIRAQGLRLRTSCSYADKWLSEHPEHWELRA